MCSLKDKANLGMTSADHREIGSSPPKVLSENPGKKLAELMSDEEIIAYMKSAIEKLDRNFVHSRALPAKELQLAKLLRDDFILPNIRYLDSIDRLPSGLTERLITKRYPL